MLFCLDFFCLRSRSFLTPGMVLLLSSNSETSVIKRGCFSLKGERKSSRGTLTVLLLVESLCFIFFQSIHSLVLQSVSVMRANKWYRQKASMMDSTCFLVWPHLTCFHVTHTNLAHQLFLHAVPTLQLLIVRISIWMLLKGYLDLVCFCWLNIVILKQNGKRQAIREFLCMFCVRTFFCTTLHIFWLCIYPEQHPGATTGRWICKQFAETNRTCRSEHFHSVGWSVE